MIKSNSFIVLTHCIFYSVWLYSTTSQDIQKPGWNRLLFEVII